MTLPAENQQTVEAARPMRYCLNVHGDMLCNGPQGHEGGCVFEPGWMLARRIEDDCLSIAAYAGDTTNELRETREDRDEAWRQHNRSELRVAELEAALREIESIESWEADVGAQIARAALAGDGGGA